MWTVETGRKTYSSNHRGRQHHCLQNSGVIISLIQIQFFFLSRWALCENLEDRNNATSLDVLQWCWPSSSDVQYVSEGSLSGVLGTETYPSTVAPDGPWRSELNWRRDHRERIGRVLIRVSIYATASS